MIMIWQDGLMMVTGVGFFLALVPTVLRKQYPPRATSVPTTILLLLNLLALSTLGLWLAFSATFVTMLLWALIACKGEK